MAELRVERVPRRPIFPWIALALAGAILVWWFGWLVNERANPVIATGTGAGLPPAGANVSDVPLVRDRSGDATGAAADLALIPAASLRGAPAPVNAYLGHITRGRAAAASGITAPAAADAFRRLAEAGRAVAPSGSPATALADSLATLARQLSTAEAAARQPALTRDAAMVGAAMLQGVQETRAPSAGGMSDVLRHAAEAIDARRPLRQQGAAVQRYLDIAGALLERVATRAT